MRIIEPNTIISISGRVINLESVALYYAIKLTHLKIIVIRGK
jgi:hypothetical protein